MFAKLSFGILLLVAVSGAPAWAQDDAIKRTVLQRADVPGTQYVSIQASAEIKPGTTVARHTHPGLEIGYVLEGEADLFVQGQPPRHLKPGDSFVNPSGVPHSLKTGDKPFKALSTYVVEKDKPLATPAPE
jgi:quercetin dioxygenase-like cupin family protein